MEADALGISLTEAGFASGSGSGSKRDESKWATMRKEFQVGGQVDVTEVEAWKRADEAMRDLEAEARFALRGSVDFGTAARNYYDDIANNLNNNDRTFLRHIDGVFVQMSFEQESVERLGEAIVADTKWSLTTGWRKPEESIAQVVLVCCC